MTMANHSNPSLFFFRHQLSASRLGQQHDTLNGFREAVKSSTTTRTTETKTKEYTLIVVTETSRQRILLGWKLRGFGKHMYNSFGGKVESTDASIAAAAQRELHEETGIDLAVEDLKESHVGTLVFTFDHDDDNNNNKNDQSDTTMMVHLFRVHISCTKNGSHHRYVDPQSIRPCEEIQPQWFDNWYDIPLHNMFADDSIWLTTLLSSSSSSSSDVLLNGWFHFCAGGQQVNSILHYHIHVQPKSTLPDENSHQCWFQPKTPQQLVSRTERPMTLERRLFHELHHRGINSPTIKEFNEAYAFVNAIRMKHSFDVILDVAGGHGALAALFLITTSAQTAVVIDPANVGKQGVERAWSNYFRSKTLHYRHECLRTGLPDELEKALGGINGASGTPRERILVVACHACQHLSDETMEIGCRYGVNVAVLPCCQRDPSPGTAWKHASQNIGIPIAKTMDLLLAGKAMSWTVGHMAGVTYDVRMKVIDEKVSPQNRIIFARVVGPSSSTATSSHHQVSIDQAHRKLEQAYRRAHRETSSRSLLPTNDKSSCENSSIPDKQPVSSLIHQACGYVNLIAAFGLGFLTASIVLKR